MKSLTSRDAPTGHKLFNFIFIYLTIAPVGAHLTLAKEMRTFIILLISILSVSRLNAEPPTLTKEQVKAIAALVVLNERKNSDPISEPRFDEKTGIWSCSTVTGVVHGDVFIDVRDKDRFSRTSTYSSMSVPKFKMPTGLRRRISNIAPDTKKG